VNVFTKKLPSAPSAPNKKTLFHFTYPRMLSVYVVRIIVSSDIHQVAAIDYDIARARTMSKSALLTATAVVPPRLSVKTTSLFKFFARKSLLVGPLLVPISPQRAQQRQRPQRRKNNDQYRTSR
jgi:hypothetical protein